ncbi:MAG: Asp23/Gls24 family envelope stress response protein [Oscillospiraceae bacterium]
MDKIKTNTITSLKISEEVVATIVKNAIKEIDDIQEFSKVPAKFAFSSSKISEKSIKVELNSETAIITIALVLNMNAKIKDVCETVQRKIKDAVQNMTGVTVSKVNVFVTGVSN